MEFGHFVLAAIVTTLLYSVSPACTLPTGDRPRQEQRNVNTTPQNTMCNNMSYTSIYNKFASCKSLQEVLLEYFSETGNSLDTSYNTFTLADIFYSGLLVSPLYNNYQHNREGMDRRGDQVCNRLLNDWLRPQSVSSGPCSWHYNCTYNSDTFPSFKVQADLDSRDAIWQQCYEVKMTRITYFQKEVCKEDPLGSAENWVPLHNQEIVVGFTAIDK